VTLARVVEIINDYTITFENGTYAVNLAGANSNIGDVVNLNSVSVRSANSAGLVQSREIEHASYNETVHVDTINGVAGTTFPTGTNRRPCNNIADALLIAQTRGFTSFTIRNTLVITSGDFTGYTFIGGNRAAVLVASGADFTDGRFESITVTGNLNSTGISIRRCAVAALTLSDAYLEESAISGTLTVVGVGPTWILNCIDADASLTSSVLDLAGFTGNLFVRAYFGSLSIVNSVAGVSLFADMQGRLELDSTVTGGSYTVRGIGRVIDNSTGSTVDTEDIVNADAVWQRDLESGETAAGIMRITLAAHAGDATIPGGVGSYAFKARNGVKTRIAGTVSGTARTVTTVDGSEP
jgi:hypothetical protein